MKLLWFKITAAFFLLAVNLLVSSCAEEESDHFILPYCPDFANEKKVIISGYSGDAMEPFISSDGNHLFFNNKVSDSNKKIFYADRVSESEFAFVDEISNVNEPDGTVDGVPSMDNYDNLYWVSAYDWNNVKDGNPTCCVLRAGNYKNGTVSAGEIISSGDLGLPVPDVSDPWITMDAEISRNGNDLYYTASHFAAGFAFLTESYIAVASRNGSLFEKTNDSDLIFAEINDPDYLVYASSVSSDGLEIFFTRILKSGGKNTEICVSRRTDISEKFQTPGIMRITGIMPEAPSISGCGKYLYYHKKDSDGLYHVFMQTRE